MLEFCSNALKQKRHKPIKKFRAFYTIDGLQLRNMQELKNFCENDKIISFPLCELEKEEAEEEKHTVYANSSLNDDLRYEPLNCNSDLRSSLASGGVDRIEVNQPKVEGYHNVYDSSAISDQLIQQPKEIRGQKILLLATKKREFKGLKLKGNQGSNSYEYGKSYKSTLDSFLKERL